MHNTKISNNLLLYNGNHAGFISSGRVTVDTMFHSKELEQWLRKKGYDVLWKEGVFLRLVDSADSFGSENSKGVKTVRIWRLRKDYPMEARFLYLSEFRKNFEEPAIHIYERIFQEEMGTENLEIIYQFLSGEGATGDFGYPLSISDVIELFDDQNSTFYYIDRYRFEVIDFVKK